jgi:aspartate racemase
MEEPMQEKTIGIMGGQGPEATLDLFRRILANTPAQTDQDHFHILIDCNPKVPNPNNSITKGEADPTVMLCANARNLEKAGADFIIIPCNTVHIFLEPIRASVKIPVLSIVDCALDALLSAHPAVQRAGILASPAVVQTGLYTRALAARGVQSVVPDAAGQQDIHDVIFAVKAGDKSAPVREKLLRICRQLMDQGSDALILGCTELPLLVSPADFPVPAIDTLEELALAAIQAARSVQPVHTI